MVFSLSVSLFYLFKLKCNDESINPQRNKTITITDYPSLLAVAKQQSTPQRFLFVFLDSSLPTDHKGEEEFRFNSGLGGELTPVMTLDKPLEELTSFENLVAESKLMKKKWQLVSVAVMSGNNGIMPTSEEALKSLEIMMKTVETGGDLSKFMTFDRKGEPVLFRT